jgi:ribosomal-protein-alanine N-acetyltransferase
MNDVKVIPFDLSFLEAVVEIEKSSFENPWTREMFLGSVLDKLTSFNVVFGQDTVKGYCIYRKVEQEAEIFKIAVSTSSRRKSYAAKMIENILQDCLSSGVKNIFLEVDKDNNAAINLYTKFGFEMRFVRNNYYKHSSSNALVLRKILL